MSSFTDFLLSLFKGPKQAPKPVVAAPVAVPLPPVLAPAEPLPKAPNTAPSTRPSIIGSEGLRLIKEFEGCKLVAYRDSGGILTVGYGHTAGVGAFDVITEAQANAFLEEDLTQAQNTVHRNCNVPLNQNQFDALCSFVFNVGSGRFNKSTLRLKLNLADYKGAADEFLKWDKVGGTVYIGLARRRKAERDLFLKPIGLKLV